MPFSIADSLRKPWRLGGSIDQGPATGKRAQFAGKVWRPESGHCRNTSRCRRIAKCGNGVKQHSQASAGQDAAPPAAVKAPAAPSGEPDRMSCPRCGRSIRAQDDWARYQHSEQCHPEFITADFSRACILQVQSGRREKARAKEEPVSAEGKGRARSSQKTAPKPKVREPHAVFDVCV